MVNYFKFRKFPFLGNLKHFFWSFSWQHEHRYWWWIAMYQWNTPAVLSDELKQTEQFRIEVRKWRLSRKGQLWHFHCDYYSQAKDSFRSTSIILSCKSTVDAMEHYIIINTISMLLGNISYISHVCILAHSVWVSKLKLFLLRNTHSLSSLVAEWWVLEVSLLGRREKKRERGRQRGGWDVIS